ncbi:uncharacterized protein LOC116840727 isoform X1 [Odontomachus brunneus]|uniref:uncharacterized protein LOC116840727 isoform X1 n=1 Tax=Odontomachus brunneus TaxID=486640 RepID=UPI0013F26608|nr:uncharacterized protein LOC116840727 isoform X1 [Odontomachus brunneus]
MQGERCKRTLQRSEPPRQARNPRRRLRITRTIGAQGVQGMREERGFPATISIISRTITITVEEQFECVISVMIHPRNQKILETNSSLRIVLVNQSFNLSSWRRADARVCVCTFFI